MKTTTIAEFAKENNYELKHTPTPSDGMIMFIAFTLSAKELILQDEEILSIPQVAIFNKRLEAFDISEKISKDAFMGILIFEFDNPAKVVLYLITLLEYYEKNGKPATLNDIMNIIYPDGFYDDETCRWIINNCLKTRETIYSYIYVSR